MQGKSYAVSNFKCSKTQIANSNIAFFFPFYTVRLFIFWYTVYILFYGRRKQYFADGRKREERIRGHGLDLMVIALGSSVLEHNHVVDLHSRNFFLFFFSVFLFFLFLWQRNIQERKEHIFFFLSFFLFWKCKQLTICVGLFDLFKRCQRLVQLRGLHTLCLDELVSESWKTTRWICHRLAKHSWDRRFSRARGSGQPLRTRAIDDSRELEVLDSHYEPRSVRDSVSGYPWKRRLPLSFSLSFLLFPFVHQTDLRAAVSDSTLRVATMSQTYRTPVDCHHNLGGHSQLVTGRGRNRHCASDDTTIRDFQSHHHHHYNWFQSGQFWTSASFRTL